jgi:hypothetical protein
MQLGCHGATHQSAFMSGFDVSSVKERNALK